MQTDLINYFGLNYEQTKILFSMEYQLILKDIYVEKSVQVRKEKEEWLSYWAKYIKEFLSNTKEGRNDSNINEVDNKNLNLKYILDNLLLKNAVDKLPLSLMLLEATLFQPYYPLSQQEESNNGKIDKIVNVVKTKIDVFHKLQYQEKEIESELQKYAAWMGLEPRCIEGFKKSYSKAINGINGTNTKIVFGIALGAIVLAVTAGYATPVIGALFAAEGTAGAAAVLSGLAALGGGAVAAGGFGVAGGIAVVVGGGVLLGGGIGAGVGAGVTALMKASSKFTLSQAAKLEVVMKEILLTSQKDIRTAQELIREQRMVIANLENQLFDMEMASESQKEEMGNLKKSIEYLNKALARSENFVKKGKLDEE